VEDVVPEGGRRMEGEEAGVQEVVCWSGVFGDGGRVHQGVRVSHGRVGAVFRAPVRWRPGVFVEVADAGVVGG